MMYSSGLPALKVHERRKPKCFEKNASCAARLRQFKAMWLIAEGAITSVHKMPTLHQGTIGQLIDVGGGHRPAECRRFGKYYSDALSQFWTGDRGQKTLHAEAYRVAHYHP